MRPLNAYRFYELGGKLRGLFDADVQKASDMFAPLTEAQTLLDGLIKDDSFQLQTSRPDAVRLLNKIGSVFNRYFIDAATKQLKPSGGDERVDSHELSMIRTLLEKFDQSLAAELNRMPSYVAEKCGIYSTYDLAENARQVFAPNLRGSIPIGSQTEFDQAGRALAYGLGTAAAMHTLRAVEIMLRTYYDAFADTPAPKNERNYGLYMKKLATLSEDESRDPRPDRRVVQMLAQVKDHYRNPLVTPETNISVEEATQLFGMASTIISLMARQKEALRLGNDQENPLADPLAEETGEQYDFPMTRSA